MTTTPTDIRTYESFSIQWDRGSNWSGFDTAAEAQAVIDGSPSTGRVVRKTWTVEVKPEHAHLYRPGI